MLTLLVSFVTGLLLLEGLARVASSIGYGSQVVAESEHRDRELIKQILAGNSPLRAGSRPILVLGDSMAFSPGVASSQLWSTLLADHLRAEVDTNVVVINAAIPGANSYHELLLTRELLPRLHPEVVLVIFNLNDVYGRHGPLELAETSPLPMPPPPDAARPPLIPALANGTAVIEAGENVLSPSLLARINGLLRRNSVALNVLLPRVNIQLKARGYLVPGTDYHHMTTLAYNDDFEGWKNTRKELVELDRTCRQFNAKLLLYVIPDFDVLKYDLSRKARTILAQYARSVGITIGFGFESFQGRAAEELAISPFDSHPNPKANRELARVIADWLKSVDAVPVRRK